MAGRISDHVVSTIARAMAEAKAGSVDAIAIVTVDATGRPKVAFGGAGDLVPSLNLGLDIMKATFMSQIVEAPGAAQMNSGLILHTQ